ncbi:hypothetical protein [Desulfitobacterium hafniense]|uniref:hypothetical protein n=1 Tax=Desulfitobacterium hafniense TaxID=49338 RepID=UPI00047837B9|nr:hypothetical protein [Desulfitobacterium hafniense]
MYPNCHKPINKGDKVNCGTCRRWDTGKQECRDAAEQYAEWDREHGWAERLMRENRGVRVE